MFSFNWPWLALLLPLPLLVRWLWPRQTTESAEALNRSTLLHPEVGELAHSFAASVARPSPAELVRAGLLMLAWTGLVLALMRPQWLEQHTEVKTRGYDLMLAVDASRSMEALDFTVEGRQVTRMAVIKGVVGRFITRRQGDRIGLVLFGDQAFVLTPLTLDTAAVRAQLEGVAPRMAGDATAIGDAIGLAVKKLRERPDESRVLVLLTDGENTAGTLPPRLAAQLARQHNIRIYTIGVGSKGLVPFVEDGRMTQVRMEIDEELLREVAAVTDGAYFRATDTRALEEIYERIDALEKTEADSLSMWIPTPLYRWPLLMALAALLAIGLFPDGHPRGLRKKSMQT